MQIVTQFRIAVGLALLGASGLALAEVPATATDTVLVVGRAPGKCDEQTVSRARELADQASKEGAYQRAGECYLAAGEDALANQAFVKAAAQTRPDTSRRLASNLDEVKAQSRQLKLAFQRR